MAAKHVKETTPTVFVDAYYEKKRDNNVTLIITKLQGLLQSAVVVELSGQIGNYAMNQGDILYAGDRDRLWQFSNSDRHVVRRPNVALQPITSALGKDPSAPRFLVEIEYKNREIGRPLLTVKNISN